MKKNFLISSFLVFLFCVNLFSQERSVYPQPTNLINVPTAGVYPRGAYAVESRVFRDGGLMVGISAGISNRFMFGISYGGARIIGDDVVIFNPQPGVEVKYRFLDENERFPAVLLGFNSQGYGKYQDSLKRYETKAKGFYLVASKNYRFLGNLGLHAGIYYNPLEDADGDRDPSFFIGIDKDLNQEISFVFEYDAALNDNETNEISLGSGKGYLNAGVRWTLVESFHIELYLNNILLNRNEIEHFSREIKITFIEFF